MKLVQFGFQLNQTDNNGHFWLYNVYAYSGGQKGGPALNEEKEIQVRLVQIGLVDMSHMVCMYA